MAQKTTEVGTERDVPLNWDVLVTPGIAVVTSDLARGTKQGMWSPISSTRFYGKRDAVLVDTFITVEQADILVDWVAASGKNLTTIYATPDFDRVAGTTTTARGLYDKMLELDPDRVNPGGALWLTAGAVKP